MYLMIGIFVGLHLLAMLINLDAAEKNNDKILVWVLLGILFGMFSVIA